MDEKMLYKYNRTRKWGKEWVESNSTKLFPRALQQPLTLPFIHVDDRVPNYISRVFVAREGKEIVIEVTHIHYAANIPNSFNNKRTIIDETLVCKESQSVGGGDSCS